eukprot:GHVT01025102.1.p1 GENE.GHVT01025102.1~~GHVT01025102.1.p1  ORF type:complete len:122 (+),score=15.32 GHVT01025102.1:1293-1658(+)
MIHFYSLRDRVVPCPTAFSKGSFRAFFPMTNSRSAARAGHGPAARETTAVISGISFFAESEKVDDLRLHVGRHTWHIDKMEQTLRLLCNDSLDVRRRMEEEGRGKEGNEATVRRWVCRVMC